MWILQFLQRFCSLKFFAGLIFANLLFNINLLKGPISTSTIYRHLIKTQLRLRGDCSKVLKG